MAIFLSRIKRALNVGSKSITNNGTYYASADGYDGYDEVTVNVSGGSATPITPSNANPVALSSGVAVEPTTNGYAIQSYDNITPPSSPQAISSGDILKMIGNGYVIDTYSTATPSDSTPPQLTQGNIYEPTANGYLYATEQPKVKTGTFTAGSSGTTNTINCGFEPSKIFVHFYSGTNSMSNVTYDSDMSDTKQISSVRTSSSNYSCAAYNIPNTNNNGVIASISSTGFVFRTGTATANKTCYYTAIG